MSLARDLAGLGLAALIILAAVFVVVGFFYALWKTLLQPVYRYVVRAGILQPLVANDGRTHQPVPGRWRHFIEIGILSVVLALVEFRVTKMATPGVWVVGRFCYSSVPGSGCDLRIILVLPIVLDASLIFAVLWGAYLVWVGRRDGRRV